MEMCESPIKGGLERSYYIMPHTLRQISHAFSHT